MQTASRIWVLLHNIRSTHNVGSIFRTSDAIGVSKIILSGYTAAPLDRFKRPVKEIAKTALGAEKTIPWEQYDNPLAIIEQTKQLGFSIVGVEQDARSVDYKTYHSKGDTLIVVGEEVDGMAPEIRDTCDALLEIPMKGKKESLNVSVAFGVLMYRVFDR